MDSLKIAPIFCFFFSFLINFHESHARTFGSTLSPSPSPAPGPSNEGCWHLSKSCRNRSLTACVDPSSAAPKELLLFVKNDGDRPLNVNVILPSHAKHIIPGMQISGHKIQEFNIAENIGGNFLIQVKAGNLECKIDIGSSAGPGGGNFGPFPIDPINAAYLLILTGLIIIGGAWACCKGGKSRQQGDGISYQELEMEQPDSPSANNVVETTGGWEQDWDGDWDELKSKAAATGHQMANGSGLTSRPAKKDGRESSWDD